MSGAKTPRMYAFRASGRFTQVHYVRATSVAEARKRWDEGFTDESDEFVATRLSAKRLPEFDQDDFDTSNPRGFL